jgi:hypothetical protein
MVRSATMNPITTTVKVCFAELDDSRRKEAATEVGREALPESTAAVRSVQP